MTARVNGCLRWNGTPKSAYKTREQAQRWIDRNRGDAAELCGIHPYPCPEHGWHVGARPRRTSHRRGRRGSW